MAQAARRVTAKDANQKLAHRRLTVLELAERLGNVAEACRRGGIPDRRSRRSPPSAHFVMKPVCGYCPLSARRAAAPPKLRPQAQEGQRSYAAAGHGIPSRPWPAKREGT
jgi:hypothetical protein